MMFYNKKGEKQVSSVSSLEFTLTGRLFDILGSTIFNDDDHRKHQS